MMDLDSQIEALIPSLRRFARGVTGDHAQADDLVQDSLERALSRLSLWRRGSDLKAWLFTITRNVWMNELARRRARPDQGAGDQGLELVAQEGGQTERMALRDLSSALDRLAPEQREVLLLVGLEGMSYAEVAEVTGVPVGTVMSRLKRGRDRLGQLMQGAEPAIRRVK